MHRTHRALHCVRLQGAAAGAAWQSVMQRRLFAQPHAAESATLAHLCAIFATRNADTWKAPDALAWLLRCAEAAAAAADAAESSDSTGCETAEALHKDQVPYADARALAEVTYPESDSNEYAHLVASSFSDVRAQLPPEQIAAMQGQGAPQDGDEMGAAELHALLQQLADGAGQRDADGQVRFCSSPICECLDARHAALGTCCCDGALRCTLQVLPPLRSSCAGDDRR